MRNKDSVQYLYLHFLFQHKQWDLKTHTCYVSLFIINLHKINIIFQLPSWLRNKKQPAIRSCLKTYLKIISLVSKISINRNGSFSDLGTKLLTAAWPYRILTGFNQSASTQPFRSLFHCLFLTTHISKFQVTKRK